MSRTTKKHFKIFKGFVKHYYKKYRLSGWHIYFSHVKISGGHHANMWGDMETKAVTFRLGKKWSTKITKEKLRKAAKHEVVHLIIWPLFCGGWNRFIREKELLALDETTAQHLSELL